SCYFCFNKNQENYQHHLVCDRDWITEFDQAQAEGLVLTHIGLTGGEPLLDPDKTVDFFSEASSRWPDAHLRLYTSGWEFDEALLHRLEQAGVDEIRFSVKLDEGIDSCRDVLAAIGMVAASDQIDAMVEMPVIPGSEDQMKQLLLQLDAVGVFGINLLEFCYPSGDWDEFGSRGFTVKNPPFPVLYDWAYAGGLPIEGSELECLRLVEFAIDEGLNLGVHYCSLENKHRDQVLTQNSRTAFTQAWYELDPDDYFYKTCKVFGDAALAARRLLERNGLDGWDFDASDNALSAHPRLAPMLRSSGIDAAISYNILEVRDDCFVLRELALKL
ncbi:MAG: radical SAM protein, partial [Raoultibacter sp.]